MNPNAPQEHYHQDYYKAQSRPNEVASVVFNDIQTALFVADKMNDTECEDFHSAAWETAEAVGTTVFVEGLSQELVESWSQQILFDDDDFPPPLK
jgi:hypothetical protein